MFHHIRSFITAVSIPRSDMGHKLAVKPPLETLRLGGIELCKNRLLHANSPLQTFRHSEIIGGREHLPLSYFSINHAIQLHTLPLSTSLVVMTITRQLSCHTIAQKSPTVTGRQPWVAIYRFSWLERSPCIKNHHAVSPYSLYNSNIPGREV